MTNIIIPIAISAGVIIALIIFLCCIYRVADIDKVLIVTGGKTPKIKVSGGSFVVPIFRKAQYFDLCMLTVTADRDEVKTKTAVPIIIDWTAQIRPDVNDMNKRELLAHSWASSSHIFRVRVIIQVKKKLTISGTNIVRHKR